MERSRISIVMEDKEKVLWKLNFGKNLASFFSSTARKLLNKSPLFAFQKQI